jgi:tRNA pseudouridine32 synthase/23S rRNA pseudouridine746 synthase
LDFECLLHVDEALLALDKPAGLLAVPGRGMADCLSARTQAHFPEALVVHRLDMATSGVLLMARGVEMQRRLSRVFAERQVHKRYVAVVAGRVEPPAAEWGLIDAPMMPDWPNRPMQKIDPVYGKPSQTRWRVMAYDADRNVTHLELEPITGRTHQLRLHMRELGHPILGDALYAPAGVAARAGRLLLHARSLQLRHPFTGADTLFESPLPIGWSELPFQIHDSCQDQPRNRS